jgi:hypothetical protein
MQRARAQAFSEYHHNTQQLAEKKFWDRSDFVCYNDNTGTGSWGARNC